MLAASRAVSAPLFRSPALFRPPQRCLSLARAFRKRGADPRLADSFVLHNEAFADPMAHAVGMRVVVSNYGGIGEGRRRTQELGERREAGRGKGAGDRVRAVSSLL